MTVIDVIKARRSVRSFTDETPSIDLLRQLCSKYPQLKPIDPALIGSGRIGTYGCISGHPAYVAVVTGDELQAGIQGEQLVLELTDKGYGTCWLGGTFNRKLAIRGTNISDNDTIPAVIAIGYPSGHQSLSDKIFRGIAGASKRKSLSELTLAGTPTPDIAQAMEAARLAPSAVNRQPWRFIFNEDGSIEVYGTPSDSFMTLDVGIAIAHFLAIRNDYTLTPNTNTHPKLSPIATLTPVGHG